MDKFIFDLQRFDEVSIVAGDTYELDGVTYTALEDSRLNLGDDGKVSGIASGNVQATVTNKKNSPTVTFDASDGAINFTATGDGSVLAVKQLFPIEFISGEFTYKGNKLNIGVGATLAIVNSRYGNYSLRNENTFEFGGTYTFTDTALTTESQHTFGTFTLTNGTDVRQLHPESFGTVINRFAERGFTLTKGSSEVLHIGGYTLTATALDDAALNIDLNEQGLSLIPAHGDGTLNVSLMRGDTTILAGELECTSGSITVGFDKAVTFAKGTSFNLTQGVYVLTATTTDEATIGISLQGDKLVFTPGQNDGGLNVLLTRGGTPVFGGELNVTDGTITFDPATQKFTFSDGTNVSIALPTGQEFGFKVTGGDARIKVESDGAGNFTLTPDEGDGSLDITVKQGGQTVFYNNISVSGGSIVLGNMGQTVGLTKGTTANVTLGNYTLTVKTTDDAGFLLGIESDGSISITPAKNDGALDISIKRDGTTIFSNTVSVDGTIIFNPVTQAMTLTDGTTISLSFGNYDLIATANGNATTALSIAGNGVVITPNTGDGSLDITLSGAGGSMNANIEVLSGSFILGEGGAITVTKGTELRIDFGGGYIVNFKATDDAGGSISLGNDGITFKPGSNDGGLQLSVTRDGETRTTNLDVTGSVTYKLDGSISLAEGTVISNTWEDGAALKITATGDEVSSVRFDPDTGLTVTDEDNNLQLELTLPNGNVIDIDSITGTLTYKNGKVTLSEGTNMHMIYSNGIEQTVTAESGMITIDFSEMADDPETSMIGYIVSDSSRVVVKTVKVDKALILTGGLFKMGTNIQLLEPGSSIYGAAGDSGTGSTTFSLDGNGEYTINGINVTVKNIDLHDKEHYGTAITLIDNKSIAFNPGTATISYDGNDFTGDRVIGIDNTGTIAIVNTKDGVSVNGTAFDDNITNSGTRVTLTGGKGDDRISLDSAAANTRINYASGDGSDTIYGFGSDDTISIAGGTYSSATSGNNLVLTVGSDKVTLFGAADLTNPNIIGTSASSGTSTTGGDSSSTTSGGDSSTPSIPGSDTSTTDDVKKALFGADDMYSIGKGGKLVTTPPNPGSGTPYTGSKDRGVTVSAPTATVTPYVSGSSISNMWRALAGIGNVTSSADAASSAGSQLWGDSYGNDNLVSGGAEDTINLAATTLDQISGAATSANATALNFTDGSSLNVVSAPAQVVNFKPEDGSAYYQNNSTDTWTKTN